MRCQAYDGPFRKSVKNQAVSDIRQRRNGRWRAGSAAEAGDGEVVDRRRLLQLEVEPVAGLPLVSRVRDIKLFGVADLRDDIAILEGHRKLADLPGLAPLEVQTRKGCRDAAFDFPEQKLLAAVVDELPVVLLVLVTEEQADLADRPGNICFDLDVDQTRVGNRVKR